MSKPHPHQQQTLYAWTGIDHAGENGIVSVIHRTTGIIPLVATSPERGALMLAKQDGLPQAAADVRGTTIRLGRYELVETLEEVGPQ